jgi:hypothetical protein
MIHICYARIAIGQHPLDARKIPQNSGIKKIVNVGHCAQN